MLLTCRLLVPLRTVGSLGAIAILDWQLVFQQLHQKLNLRVAMRADLTVFESHYSDRAARRSFDDPSDVVSEQLHVRMRARARFECSASTVNVSANQPAEGQSTGGRGDMTRQGEDKDKTTEE